MKWLPLFILVVFLACKKKKDPTPIDSTTPPVNNNPANSSLANGLPANTGNINGVFLAQKLSIPSSSFTVYQSYASLNVSGNSLQAINPISILLVGMDNAGTVKINSNILKFETINAFEMHRYTDTTASPNYTTGVIWYLGGNTSFSSFTTTITRGFPIISNTGFLPTTISKTQSLTINFGSSNISNADSIIVEISGPGLNVSKTLAGSTQSVNFTAAQLSNATVGTSNAQFLVYVKNYSNMSINNKTHVFIMMNSLSGFANVTP